jgi:hypothetical protein
VHKISTCVHTHTHTHIYIYIYIYENGKKKRREEKEKGFSVKRAGGDFGLVRARTATRAAGLDNPRVRRQRGRAQGRHRERGTTC